MATSKSIWTLAEAQEQLGLWKNAMKALATGQVSEYVIGSRRLTMLDSDEIQRRIDYFADKIDALQNNVNSRTVRRVVPRDL